VTIVAFRPRPHTAPSSDRIAVGCTGGERHPECPKPS